jgi:glycosyltransferase involved in cell wall biosynthesis
MPYKGKKIAIVMPAYNAEKTLVACYNAIPKDWADIIILVDDASKDGTVEVARSLPIIVEAHQKNRGYGGNQKTCYRLALQHGADIAVMVHPDHQYDPKFIPEMIKAVVDGGYRAVFGSRMMVRKNALAGGMPPWKFFFNILLTALGNIVLGIRLTEFHSGFRAYDTSLFRTFDIEKNSDNFVFDTEIIIQLASRRIPIKEIPITTKYFPEASQIRFLPSVRYGLGIMRCLFLYATGRRAY